MGIAEFELSARIAKLPGAQRRALIRRMSEQGLDPSILPIVPFQRNEPLPLSYAQRSLWLTWKIDPLGSAYNLQGTLVLKGVLDIQAFSKAIDELASRHEILRTLFVSAQTDDVEQHVLSELKNHLQVDDLTQLPASQREDSAHQTIHEHVTRPFAIDTEPSWRACLLQLDEETHWFSLAIHHMIADGWSMSVLIHEVSQLYQTYSAGGKSQLTPLSIQFADYVLWQHDLMASGELFRQLDYWKNKLDSSPGVLPLALDRPRLLPRSGSGAVHKFKMNGETLKRLRRIADGNGATLFMVILAIFKLVLARYSGANDVSIGSPIANRQRVETQNLIGYLTNILVMRTQLNLHNNFTQVLMAVRETVLDAQNNADCPFDLLVSNLSCVREPGVHPLFQVKCAEQTSAEKLDEFCGLSITPYPRSSSLVHFDLSLDFIAEETEIICGFTYATDIFDDATVIRMAELLIVLADSVAAESDAPVYELFPANNISITAGKTGNTNKTIVDRWKQSATENPEGVCVQHHQKLLSYAELDHYSNQLAAQLVKFGVVAETRVAIHAERSIEFVAAVIAVLKAGGTYVPLDPALPAERLVYQIQDSGAALLLSADAVAWNPGVPVLLLNDEIFSGTAELPAIVIHPQQAAYVIYTSGSTGKPKGVVVSHGALANYVQALLARLSLPDTAQSMAMVSTVAADLGNTVLFGALCSGRTLHLISSECAFDPDAFASYMHQHRVDVLKIVPSHLQALLNAANPERVLPETCLIVGGETTRWSLLKQIEVLKPACRVLNHYGPTETTVGVLTQEAHEALTNTSGLPIGIPLDNNQAYALDAELNPVPLGVAGELYVGGNQVARGYQSRANQTAERFIASPFDNGERLYRTGDRVRMLKDNSLEFLGRVDDQIKVRGYRVELREIAQALRAQSGVAQAEVIARENDEGRTKLYGYVVAQPDTAINGEQLRDALRHALPDYMVPDAIQLLESLPLTANGKLDRKALPNPEQQVIKNYIAPQGEAEEMLAQIWCEVLGVDQVGRYDNFFALGGDSILSLKVVARARKRGLTLAPKQLFEQPSLQTLAHAMSSDNSPKSVIPPNKIPVGCTFITPDMLTLITLEPESIRVVEQSVPGGAANIQDIYPLAPLQEGILFHHVLQTQGDAYVTSRLLSFDSRQRLDSFIENFNRVIARQDILRTAVLWEKLPEPLQVVYRQAELSLQWLEPHESIDASVWLTEQVHPRHFRIDARKAPMLHATAIHDVINHRWLLMLLVHHLIDDNTTVKHIVEEIALFQQGREAELPTPVPFRNFVAQARAGVDRQQHETFFKRMLGDVEEPTAPFDLLDIQGDGSQLVDARLRVGDHLANQIRRQAKTLGVNTASFFHLAWALVLAKTTGKDDVVFGTVLFGRMKSGENMENAAGMFINTLPLRLQIGQWDVESGLKHTYQLLTELLHYEHASLSIAQRCSGVAAGVPLFNSLLNYRYGAQVVETRDATFWQGIDLLGGQERTNYPLGVSVDDLGDGFNLVAQVHQQIDAQKICIYLQNALHQIANALDQHQSVRILELNILDQQDHEQLLSYGVNSKCYPDHRPVHSFFEEQAASQPDATALLFDEEQLSYAELNRRSNQLAHYLIGAGVKPETRVGIAVERSIDMVVGLLGILKAGGAYVPLDLEYPQDRLAYMIEDSGIELLLLQRHLRDQLPIPDGLCTLELEDEAINLQPVHNPQVPVSGDNLAYVIYTSGSTGKPKGAANRHISLGSCMQWMQDSYGLTPADTVLHKAAFGFDVSAWELFWPLTSGARLALARPGDHRDPARIIELIRQHRVTTLNFVPVMLQAFLAQEGIEHQTNLRFIICGGEAMPAATQEEALARLQGASLQNLYGPTEAAIHVTRWTCRADGKTQVPIGRPISGVQTWVLDGNLNPVPPGVAGELYLGGINLGRGYLNRPSLTAERFIADPQSGTGERLYRTGDLVRWNAEGQLEYLGRIDHQVKIRGFRIELGEVEAQLLEQPEVRESVVVAQEGLAGSRLVGYVSLHAANAIDAPELRARLAAVLPDYMVPSAIVVMDRLPLNANGKVDRKALPVQDFVSEQVYEAPQGEAEETLAQIWAEVLGVERVGRNDNFFELGGHSLLALMLLQRIHNRFNTTEMSLAQVLKNSDFISQLDAIKKACANDESVIALTQTGHGVPIYCFPGTAESSSSYQKVAEAFIGERPVYAFISHALTSKRWHECSMDSLASEYAEYIISSAKDGMCALLGWSLGADLAYETAIRLEGKVDVVFLGLVDAIDYDLSHSRQLSAKEVEGAQKLIDDLLETSKMKKYWSRTINKLTPVLWNHFASKLLLNRDELILDGPGFDSAEYRYWVSVDALRIASGRADTMLNVPAYVWSADPVYRAEDILPRDWSKKSSLLLNDVVLGSRHLDIMSADDLVTGIHKILVQLP